MKDILYHGSYEIVKKPEYGKGRLNNDYGRGFYCTKHIELAKEWASSTTSKGYVNAYEIDLSKLQVLNLLEDKYHILHWLALLLSNREITANAPITKQGIKYIKDNYLIDTSKYDVVVGYRADDSYFSFARDFLNNTITLQQLSNAMKLGSLKEQYVLISPKAFKQIIYLESIEVDTSIYFRKREDRDYKARKEYFELQTTLDKDGIYLRDIMNGVTFDDASL